MLFLGILFGIENPLLDISAEVDQALASGLETAERLQKIGLIRSAALNLQGVTRVIGPVSALTPVIQERTLVHA